MSTDDPQNATQAIRQLHDNPLTDTSPWALPPPPRQSTRDLIQDVLDEVGDDALTMTYRRILPGDGQSHRYQLNLTRCSQCFRPTAAPVDGRCGDCHDRYLRNRVTDPIGTLRHYDGTVVQCDGYPKRDPAPHGGKRWWKTVVHNPHHPLTVANECIAKWPVIYGGFDY